MTTVKIYRSRMENHDYYTLEQRPEGYDEIGYYYLPEGYTVAEDVCDQLRVYDADGKRWEVVTRHYRPALSYGGGERDRYTMLEKAPSAG